MKRRHVIQSAAALGAAAALSPLVGTSPAQAANPFAVAKYKVLVPEIFKPIPDAPQHTTAVVIGSGFGGAVAALRLARAGVDTTVIERGSRWPLGDPRREVFSPDMIPDGRAFWFRNVSSGVVPYPLLTDSFGGVLDVTEFDGIQVWRAAAVGGGSIVYTGAHPIPRQAYFDHVFGGSVSYAEMAARYYPLAASMLQTSLMPEDIYRSDAYSHSREWDRQVAAAGYAPVKIPGVWDWDVMRREERFLNRRSATQGESNFGNSNGVKRGLTLNYLKAAEQTGKVRIYPGHEVLRIGRDSRGRYLIEIKKLAPTGDVLSVRVITCDRLFLAAGSIGTTDLLMRARATGTLPDLNEHIGRGWGTNGDAAMSRGFNRTGMRQGAASRSMISDVIDGMPVTMENWFVPGLPLDIGIIGSLGMTLDDQRADFSLDSRGKLALTWPGQRDSVRALGTANARIADAAGVSAGVGLLGKSVNDFFTAHPLGGAVLGRATDAYGRVRGYDGLYVIDGALVPGNAGAVNPAITITALAERNMAHIVANAG